DRYWIALFVINFEVDRFCRSLVEGDGHLKNFLRRLLPWVLQNAPLIAHMEVIAVRAVRLVLRRRHGDAMALGIFDEIAPGTKGPFPPRGNDLDRRIQGQI